MTWSQQQLDAFREMRQFYIQWIADIEAGNPTVTHRVLGEIVDDRDETLTRYHRNVAEIEEILAAEARSKD